MTLDVATRAPARCAAAGAATAARRRFRVPAREHAARLPTLPEPTRRGSRSRRALRAAAAAAAAGAPVPAPRFALATLLYGADRGCAVIGGSGAPLLSEMKRRPCSVPPGHATGALTLLQSAADVGTRAERVVLCGGGVPPRRARRSARSARGSSMSTRAGERRAGAVAALAEFGAARRRLGLGQWLKLALWELDDYDAVSRASTPTSLSRMKLSPPRRLPAPALRRFSPLSRA